MQLFLPLAINGATISPYVPELPVNGPLVHLPHFTGEVPLAEMAIFWFGEVTPAENYADLRFGYNPSELYINVAVVDRRLWYDTNPSPTTLEDWDAVSLYIQTTGSQPARYRFVMQLSPMEHPERYEAAYQYLSGAWQTVGVPFEGSTAWRGNALNSTSDDRGWVARFHIPFTALGLDGPPSQGLDWLAAVVVHDRDEPAAPLSAETWPPDFQESDTSTWARLSYGIPTYIPPPAGAADQVVVRHKLDGQVVIDGEVGGGSICGDGLDFWTEWGDAVYPGNTDKNSDFNIQNQADIADWPCFAKYYVTFPLEALPAGRVVLSATLTLHQMGSSGNVGQAGPSFIQVLRVDDAWNEATLSWNNAPLAAENLSGAWVDPVTVFPGWPGIPWSWDISRGVAESYAAGGPLRLVFYTADSQYHSGKYFVSSDTGDWNAVARPTLKVELGQPLSP